MADVREADEIRRIAQTAGRLAGNRHMRAGGRKEWDASDMNAAEAARELVQAALEDKE